MAATARLNREYAWRLLGVGAVMVGMTGWALYDGFVAYPRMNARYEAIRPALVGHALTAGELIKPAGDGGASRYERAFEDAGMKVPKTTLSKLKALNEQARAKVVPSEQAEHFRGMQVEEVRGLLDQPLKSAHEIQSQFVMAALAAIAALAAFGAVARKAGRRFTADGAGLHGFDPAAIPYESVTSADWAKWEEKRIVRFMLRDGRRLKLDGWHFKGAEAIVEELLQHRPELKP